MNAKKTRRRYTREFKLEAIRLVERRGGKVTEVAAWVFIPTFFRDG